MIEVLNKQSPQEEQIRHVQDKSPVVDKTVLSEVKSFLVQHVCHGCFKFVDDVRLSDVAKQLPVCAKCEQERRDRKNEIKL